MHTLSPDADAIVTQRYAHAELMTCLELLKEGEPWDTRAARLMFLEAAREYLDVETKLDPEALRAGLDLQSTMGRRRCARANLLTCLELFATGDDVTIRMMDRMIRHVGEYLRSEPISNG